VEENFREKVLLRYEFAFKIETFDMSNFSNLIWMEI